MPAIKGGDFVHIVATVNVKKAEGKILYVNPSSSTIDSDAATEPGVELLVADAAGQELFREPVVVRKSSCDDHSDVGMIQVDILRQPGMQAIVLLVNGKAVARYEAGTSAPTAPEADVALEAAAGPSPHRRTLTLEEAAEIEPQSGVTYSVQVKPDNSDNWNTIAVGRPTPKVEIDRNQFAAATKARVRILRTNGFEEDVIAENVVDLF